MNAILNDQTSSVRHAVERLVSEYGFRAVTAALMLRLVRPTRAPAGPMIGQLSEHMRRDIGLPPAEVERPLVPVIMFPPIR